MNGPPGTRPVDHELAIEASGLVKAYRDVHVLSGVDLRVPRGSVFALLGPNGAGKTTTVRILATLTRADAGQARVAGFDVRRDRSEVRRRISLTGQFAALDEAQTGEENLRMMGRLSRLSRAAARRRAAELIEQFELTAAGRRRVGTYSGGMRRRLDIAASLVGHPSVIFLDEPSTGLDPQSRLTMWQVIAGLAASGVTVFLTTQYLEEADRLAGRIAVLDAGRLIAEGTGEQLKRRVAAQRLDLTCSGPGGLRPGQPVFRRPGGAPGPGPPDGGRADRRQRRAGARAAGRGRPGPGPDRELRRARRHPGRRFPHPDRTREGDRRCLTH